MTDKDRGKFSDDSVTRDEEGNPRDVGKSVTKGGEELSKPGKEPGRDDMGEKDDSGRPIGMSTARDRTGIDPQDPIDPTVPNAAPGKE